MKINALHLLRFLLVLFFAVSSLQAGQKPNVLFISMDDLNDWTGCLGGHPQARTPNLDRLAATGVLFENAHCAAPACNPSRTAIMTGISPHVSGLYANGQKMREVLPDAELMPKTFARNGYWSGGSGKILHYFIDARSWDEYYPHKRTENPFPPHMPWGKRPKSLPRGGPWQYVETDWHAFDVSDDEFGGDAKVADWVSGKLMEKHEKPFFIACGIYRPHEPWFVPKKYFDLFPLEDIQLPPGYKADDLDDLPPAGKRRGPNRYFAHIRKHGQWKRGVQAYLASIAFADAMVGRVLDALEKSPHRDNTIVVLWSDHGWHLGEKQHWQKFTAWRAVSRVPLIVRAPKGTPGLPAGTKAGSVCTRPVNLLSLFPTLLELCGLPPKADNDGPSLVPLLKNPKAAWPHVSLTHLNKPGSFGLSTEEWRYIRYTEGGEELYNIKTDPHEWANLAEKPEHAEKLGELRSRGPDTFAPFVSSVLKSHTLRRYVERFNGKDHTHFGQAIANEAAADWMAANVPRFECPDRDIEEIYHFRWWTFRKHIKQTPDGFVITEFLPKVNWSGKHNTISCPAGHHFREGRWIRDRKYLDDYAVFWFRKGGSPRRYSFWAADAVYQQALVLGDFSRAAGLLPDLVANYEAWEKSRLEPDGLFWQIDDRDGMEVSIGGRGHRGQGKRATINAYMYGDALAIAAIADRAGKPEIVKAYRKKSARLKRLVQEKLWDGEAEFFKVLPRGENAVKVDVRELHGYTPWYFNLPEKDKGYEVAWQQLMDPKGFHAPFGPTVAEQRHPQFSVSYKGHECQWNGPSWPFATAVTLTALANVLNHYPQQAVTSRDYFETLKIYTRSHRLKQEDGTVVPWIDENLNPFTGDWIARTRLKAWKNGTWDAGKGGVERGKDYNHSSYCDLIITGLVGLRPRADETVEVNPLLPDGVWDYFCLDRVPYHGRLLTILYDKTGKKYGKGRGLRILADGKEIGAASKLKRLTAHLPPKRKKSVEPQKHVGPLKSHDGSAPPNILFCLSDDQSYPHASAYGEPVVKTPVFDRIAREGVLFTHAFCASPSCTPSRSAILTGQAIWRLGQGGQLFGTLPADKPVYTDLLKRRGYHVGYMDKGWAPGNVGAGGRTSNPAGTPFQSFQAFLSKAPAGKPWCFWFGSRDPHRAYRNGSGVRSGMNPKNVTVPGIFPDTPEVRSDMCDYFFEIQRFDRQVGEMLALLEKAGQLDNTMVVVTSDNGMPFPRAKANLYDLGTRMPLAIRWPGRIPGGRTVDDFVNLTDLAPTFLTAAGLTPPDAMTGRSLLSLLQSSKSGVVEPDRDAIFCGRERHAWCRINGTGYPMRMIRTRDFLYVRNYQPDRWPAGIYRMVTNEGHYGDIDASPTKNIMIKQKDEFPHLFDRAFGKRPREELYDCRKDPDQLRNLATDPACTAILQKLSARLTAYLKATGDPRETTGEALWDAWPYFGYNRWKVLPAQAADPKPKTGKEAPRKVHFDPVIKKIEGWTVHVDPKMLEGEHAEAGARALSMLGNHLQRIAILMPEERLKEMRTLEIWIEHDHPDINTEPGPYHPGVGWLTARGYDPRLAKKVHITRAASLLSRHHMVKHPAVILHELAHAYHHQILGFDEPRIKAAYEKAMKAKLYDNVLLYTGRKVRHYGATNPMEYFAEGTEAYFYRNDFYPFVRAELKEHDPVLHDLLEEIWGPIK